MLKQTKKAEIIRLFSRLAAAIVTSESRQRNGKRQKAKKMNITDLISSGANVNLTVSLPDLKEFALSIYEEGRRRAEAEAKPNEAGERLTAEEFMKLYNVSQTALWRWEKNGYLVPTRLGKKRFYDKREIERIMGVRRA